MSSTLDAKAADVEEAENRKKASAKKRGFGEGGQYDEAVKEGNCHGKLTPRKEGLVTMKYGEYYCC
eukprot:5435842-Pleurochrysis_carterae.AAC.1